MENKIGDNTIHVHLLDEHYILQRKHHPVHCSTKQSNSRASYAAVNHRRITPLFINFTNSRWCRTSSSALLASKRYTK